MLLLVDVCVGDVKGKIIDRFDVYEFMGKMVVVEWFNLLINIDFGQLSVVQVGLVSLVVNMV